MHSPETWLLATTLSGIAILEAKKNNDFLLLGASCKTLIPPSAQYSLKSLVLQPERGKDAVLAISINTTRDQLLNEGYLISVYWLKERLMVDLKKNFISPLGRVGQVIGGGNDQSKPGIVVLHDNQRFIFGASHLSNNLQCRRIEDPNLLCKFLVGEIGGEELDKVAEPNNWPPLMIENSLLERKLLAASEMNIKLLAENQELKRQEEILQAFANEIIGQNESMVLVNAGLLKQCEQLRLKIVRARYALGNVSEQRTLLGFLAWVKIRKTKKILN